MNCTQIVLHYYVDNSGAINECESILAIDYDVIRVETEFNQYFSVVSWSYIGFSIKFSC